MAKEKETLVDAVLKISAKADRDVMKQIEHIHNAELELEKAGITFDSGHNLSKGKITEHDWELDWSLKGAKLVFKRFKKKKHKSNQKIMD